MHEAIYPHDPDHNGIELDWDHPCEAWSRTRTPVDFAGLLAETGEPGAGRHLPALASYT